ncbi:hypothetical protein [Nocardia vinacea]
MATAAHRAHSTRASGRSSGSRAGVASPMLFSWFGVRCQLSHGTIR